MDVGAWLRGLGLERYEQAFREHDVDATVLPKLTAEDLAVLGVSSVGHRRRLLEAIAALRTDAGAPAVRPERRPLTVAFVDLVGSTALASSLDPEEMQEVLRAYQNAVASEITRLQGHVAKFLGDGVLAYFGWPTAQEDEAERAVRAGLAIVEAIGRLDTPAAPEHLAVRVGIATGLVVVGDLIGQGGAQEEILAGETPNLAARLQALAQPGQVVVAERTRRLLGGLFEVEELGPCVLRGFSQPVRAFRVLGPSRAEGRFEALHAETSLTPLVGREQELALLLGRWQQAKQGKGQVVLLAGEPGIGKSRMVLTLRERVRGQPCASLRYQCSPHHGDSVLWPIADQLGRAAGFLPHDTPEAKLDKLALLLGRVTVGRDPREDASALAPLLGIPIPAARRPSTDLAPRQRKARIFDLLLAQLQGLAREWPVLIVLEDAHWADATTVELFDLAIERVQHLPVLLVVTFRPEFQPPWTTYAHATLLTLNRLGARQATAIVERVAGGRALPAEVLDRILARADGVPLFVEELTKVVLELDLLHEDGQRYILTGPLPTTAIPDTLHGSLLARLDRLAPVKEVAQIGAVIGREFDHRVLAAVAPLPKERLTAALEELIDAELIFRHGQPPEAVYVFKHALVQEAAYASLLRSRRQQLHARVAQVLEERFPEIVAVRPELLAHHCTEAGLSEKALAHWWLAGQAAVAQSAPAEAVGHFRKALGLLDRLPDTNARAELELEIRTALGGALMAGTAAYAAPETGATYDRARELCERLGKSDKLVPLMFGQWAVHLTRGELPAARALAEEAFRLAESRDDERGLSVAHRLVGVSALWSGQPRIARRHLEQALAFHDAVRDRHSALLYAWDQRVAALACVAIASWQLGYPERAATRHREALARARELGDTASLAHALSHGCMLHHLLRDYATAFEHADALASLCVEQRLRFPVWVAAAAVVRGAAGAKGRAAEAVAAPVARALRDYQATGSRLFLPFWFALLAGMLLDTGRHPEASAALAEARAWANRTDQCWVQPELRRLEAKLLRLSRHGAGAAEAALSDAIAVAQGQGARSWELRAACDLARCWAERGERRRARDLLGPVFERFTEGFDTPDLQEARTLLDMLY